jgi:uncharacterized membrane protein
MRRCKYSIDVDIPIRDAYAQWTHFEEYPSFMPTVKRVVQRDDKTFEMTSTVFGMRYRWIAEITDRTPDAGVAWKSTSGSGSEYATRVLLQSLGEDRTRVTMKAEVDPKGLVEPVALKLLGPSFLERRIKGDLTGFKRFVESRHNPIDTSRRHVPHVEASHIQRRFRSERVLAGGTRRR